MTDRLVLPDDLSDAQREAVERLVAECGLAHRPFEARRRDRQPAPPKKPNRKARHR